MATIKEEGEELLLADLCGRVPYKPKIKIGKYCDYTLIGIDLSKEKPIIIELDGHIFEVSCKNVQPVLRPLSSMTDEEREEWTDLFNKELLELEGYSDEDAEEVAPQMFAMSHFSSINWLYSKHFNTILPKEAFIEVTKENNPYK